ncbi:MAG: hypothetical protein A7316_02580 [Candidatus Altiarchaeales archaeon WOR_SM1_86-2]|nr:MAG: hypothetical protein A7315_14765 [Candidatus Altiarchaeales archaeon WOR_SM1_79]ODS36474.1 MAG: hypothetical protein A7316_02580 [Candidatus Altiarchaeales archaeon WOR_SM1_86-2]
MKDIIVVLGFILLGSFIAAELGIATSIVILLSGIIAHYTVSFDAPGIIEVLANIGLLTLLYVAGLEIDFDLMREELKTTFIMGFSAIIYLFGAVLILTTFFLGFEPYTALLATIALSATSIAVIYPILRSREGGDLDKNGKLILSSAMIAELCTICIWGVFFSDFSIMLTFLLPLCLYLHSRFHLSAERYSLILKATSWSLSLK